MYIYRDHLQMNAFINKSIITWNMIIKQRLVLGVTPLSSRGEVNNYCHFVQSETYEACPEKNFYTYIYYYFKSWIALNKQSLIDVEITL